MSIRIERLTANDFEEMLYVMNTAFSEHDGHPMDFRRSLPKMCKPTDECMSKHIAVKDEHGIQSVLGIYPLPTVILGKELMFSTVGNVATLPAARGRGYMTMLLDKAMQGLEEIGADASRLFGNRVRYGRYGYLPCGTIHNFTVTPQKGVCRHRFVPIEGASDSVLQDCMTLQKSAPFYVKRETPDVFYDTLIAWEDSPYAVYDENDHFCGYISVTKDRSAIYEIACTSTEDFKSVLESYRAKATAPFSVDIPPYLMKEIAYLSGFAACQIKNPSLFFVRHWDKVADALLRLKASYTALPDFRTVIGIEGQCNLEIAVEHGKTFCQKTNAAADKIMNALDASEYLFGTDRLPDAQNDIFPLPMTWITLDRV